jgi:hypothetical protein
MLQVTCIVGRRYWYNANMIASNQHVSYVSLAWCDWLVTSDNPIDCTIYCSMMFALYFPSENRVGKAKGYTVYWIVISYRVQRVMTCPACTLVLSQNIVRQ